jgi:hypothetical protein
VKGCASALLPRHPMRQEWPGIGACPEKGQASSQALAARRRSRANVSGACRSNEWELRTRSSLASEGRVHGRW